MTDTVDPRPGPDWHVIAPGGRLDNMTSAGLASAIKSALEVHDGVALDCEALEYISSAGLAVLIEGARAARQGHRRFFVCRPSARVRQLLQLSRVEHFLDVREDLPC